MRILGGVKVRFLDDDSGATMVEYGIMVGLIAAVCIAIVSTMGGTVQGLFSTAAAAWAAA